MAEMHILLDHERVDAYLREHGLTEGSAPIDAALLQQGGMQSGAPAVLLVAEVEGKKRVFKISARLLDALNGAVLGTMLRLAQEAEQNKGQN